MSRTVAILPAAGLGTRMGAETPKQFLELDGMPLVIFTLRRLAACAEISEFSDRYVGRGSGIARGANLAREL